MTTIVLNKYEIEKLLFKMCWHWIESYRRDNMKRLLDLFPKCFQTKDCFVLMTVQNVKDLLLRSPVTKSAKESDLPPGMNLENLHEKIKNRKDSYLEKSIVFVLCVLELKSYIAFYSAIY